MIYLFFFFVYRELWTKENGTALNQDWVLLEITVTEVPKGYGVPAKNKSNTK